MISRINIDVLQSQRDQLQQEKNGIYICTRKYQLKHETISATLLIIDTIDLMVKR